MRKKKLESFQDFIDRLKNQGTDTTQYEIKYEDYKRCPNSSLRYELEFVIRSFNKIKYLTDEEMDFLIKILDQIKQEKENITETEKAIKRRVRK